MNSNKGNIVWLASYPKSGNTWIRIFLQNILSKTNIPVDINSLVESHIATDRALFDDHLGISSSDLTFEEIDHLRPLVYEKFASSLNTQAFIKVHDAWSRNPNGSPLFPNHITKKVIYIIRNPLDVVVSLANHNGISIENAVSLINNSNNYYCANPYKLAPQLRHQLSDWSTHVKTWIKESDLPHHIVRYEDLHSNPLETFKKLTDALEINCSIKKIKQAIKFSNFKTLQRQEQKTTFKEKPINASSFFHSGKIGEWQNYLNKEMEGSILLHHGATMQDFGYI